ncbi:MAG: response regulator [Gammaproteobacteria bacterium]|jgi:twitching motility two-component system response regulator PilH|nr:response regulator [Gammaproteobacteria bacterium]
MRRLRQWFTKREASEPKLISNYGKNATVLVVDDSRTALVSLNKLLRKLDFQCLTATNARDGIEMAKSLLPDLILMDVVMPEINGFQATRLLRNLPETAHIPIIIISGNKMQTEEFWGEKMGANGFLPKPLDPHNFLELVAELLKTEKRAVS